MQPQGFEKEKNKVCLLNKSLYGLKQSGKLWNKTGHDFFTENDFVRSEIDEYVQGTKTVYYLLYKIEGILSTVHKIMYFMNNMLTSRDNVLRGCQNSLFFRFTLLFINKCVEARQFRIT